MDDGKRYGYTYNGSALAHQKPLTKEQIISYIEQATQRNTCSLEKFQVYELVPVKVVPTTKLEIV